MGWVKVVGIGPGNEKDMTRRAVDALEQCDTIIGYITYIKLIESMIQGKDIASSGMRQEVDRCRKALELAKEGKKVCVISSGDPGIYGMAGLILELAKELGDKIDIEIIPGVSAVNSAAALLGAPLMHDFAVISLSDHLTPWDIIEKRLHRASEADFVLALYNPKSRERKEHLTRALRVIGQYKDLATPVGIVKNASREEESVIITTLSDVEKHEVDMTTIVIIGNRNTFTEIGKMITPRGYVL